MESSKRDTFAKNYAKRIKSSKPEGDADRELRGREMSEDPMLDYLKRKERAKQGTIKEIPSYKGHYPPNRFNIRPGYRWDGVDRSNGYEKKALEKEAEKKAREEEIYRHNTRGL